jgi:hypothetical protein
METRHKKSFLTAAARRRQEPIVWEIDGRDIKFRASVDLATIGKATSAIDSSDDEDENGSVFDTLVAKRDKALDAMRLFIEPDSLDDFNAVAPDIDLPMLMQGMLMELITEYTGQENPTQASPSSDGSLETSVTSTAGAQQEE